MARTDDRGGLVLAVYRMRNRSKRDLVHSLRRPLRASIQTVRAPQRGAHA